jgi:ribosome maturation factor RimP
MPPASAGRSAAQLREQLLDVLGPVVAATGYDLEDVSVTAAGRRSLVRVVVDADGGVDLDAIARVSRVVSDALEEGTPGGDAFAEPFVLEVSSPGVDRPLAEPRHWRRAIGRLVTAPVGDATVTGRVVGASDDGVELDVDGARRVFGWAEIGRGRVQVEFNRSEPGED